MAVVTIATLKTYFETGDFPTQAQFVDLIDTLQAAGENQIYSTTVSLTAAQIKTANSVPIDVVSAPGIGKVIEVIASGVKFITNTTPFTSGEIDLVLDTATTVQYFSSSLLLSSGIDNFQKLLAQTGVNNLIENKKLTVKTDADSAVGNGTIKAYIFYRIITV